MSRNRRLWSHWRPSEGKRLSGEKTFVQEAMNLRAEGMFGDEEVDLNTSKDLLIVRTVFRDQCRYISHKESRSNIPPYLSLITHSLVLLFFLNIVENKLLKEMCIKQSRFLSIDKNGMCVCVYSVIWFIFEAHHWKINGMNLSTSPKRHFEIHYLFRASLMK